MSCTKNLIMNYEEADTADRETLVRTYPEFFGSKPKAQTIKQDPDMFMIESPDATAQHKPQTVVGECAEINTRNFGTCQGAEIVKNDIIKHDGQWFRVTEVDAWGVTIKGDKGYYETLPLHKPYIYLK